MINKSLHGVIDDLSSEQARVELVTYLKRQLLALSGDSAQAVNSAYDIAGFLATDYARSLRDDDPIDEILTIAGELETEPDNANVLRDELVGKISSL